MSYRQQPVPNSLHFAKESPGATPDNPYCIEGTRPHRAEPSPCRTPSINFSRSRQALSLAREAALAEERAGLTKSAANLLAGQSSRHQRIQELQQNATMYPPRPADHIELLSKYDYSNGDSSTRASHISTGSRVRVPASQQNPNSEDTIPWRTRQQLVPTQSRIQDPEPSRFSPPLQHHHDLHEQLSPPQTTNSKSAQKKPRSIPILLFSYLLFLLFAALPVWLLLQTNLLAQLIPPVITPSTSSAQSATESLTTQTTPLVPSDELKPNYDNQIDPSTPASKIIPPVPTTTITFHHFITAHLNRLRSDAIRYAINSYTLTRGFPTLALPAKPAIASSHSPPPSPPPPPSESLYKKKAKPDKRIAPCLCCKCSNTCISGFWALLILLIAMGSTTPLMTNLPILFQKLKPSIAILLTKEPSPPPRPQEQIATTTTSRRTIRAHQLPPASPDHLQPANAAVRRIMLEKYSQRMFKQSRPLIRADYFPIPTPIEPSKISKPVTKRKLPQNDNVDKPSQPDKCPQTIAAQACLASENGGRVSPKPEDIEQKEIPSAQHQNSRSGQAYQIDIPPEGPSESESPSGSEPESPPSPLRAMVHPAELPAAGDNNFMSLNLQGKNLFLEGSFIAIGLQESQYQSHNGLPEGYLSESQGIKLWTRWPHRCLLKSSYMVAALTQIEGREIYIIVVHLFHRGAQQRHQIERLTGLICHLKSLDTNANIVTMGDFNRTQEDLEIPLSPIQNSQPTWFRTNHEDQHSSIDHFYVAEHLEGDLRILASPSDHKRIESKIIGFRQTKANKVFVEVPSLCRVLSNQIDWPTLSQYPKVSYHRWYDGRKVFPTNDTEEYNALRIQRRRERIEEPLVNRRAWQNLNFALKFKPITTHPPLTSAQGLPLLRQKHQRLRMLEILQSSTGQTFRKCRPQGLNLATDDPRVAQLIQDLKLECTTLNANKAAGADGVHPSALKAFCRANPANCDMLLLDALTRPTACSARLAIAPKGENTYRPIQIINSIRTNLEKVILRRLDLETLIVNKTELFGFRKHLSTHDAVDKVLQLLTAANNLNPAQRHPALFLDLSKAFDSCDLRTTLQRIQERLPHKSFEVDILSQILGKHNAYIGGKYFRQHRGTPQGSVVSPALFNLCIDSIFSEIKQRFPQIELVSFADDIFISGSFDFTELRSFFSRYGLSVNVDKSASFFKKIEGIRLVNTQKYLGIQLHSNGSISGLTAAKTYATSRAKQIAKFKYPAKKCYMAAKALIHSKLMYVSSQMSPDQRTKIQATWIASAKLAMALPRSLPQPVFAAFEARISATRHSIVSMKLLRDFMRQNDKIKNGQIIKIQPEMLGWPIEQIKEFMQRNEGAISRFVPQAAGTQASQRDANHRAQQEDPVQRQPQNEVPAPARGRPPAQPQASAARNEVRPQNQVGLTEVCFCILVCQNRKLETENLRAGLREPLRLQGCKPSFVPNLMRQKKPQYLIVNPDDPTEMLEGRRTNIPLLPKGFHRDLHSTRLVELTL